MATTPTRQQRPQPRSGPDLEPDPNDPNEAAENEGTVAQAKAEIEAHLRAKDQGIGDVLRRYLGRGRINATMPAKSDPKFPSAIIGGRG